MQDLKPCPFCGSEAEFHIYGRSCNVVCDGCQIGTRLEHIDEYEVAIDAWNTRVERTCVAESHDCGDGITGLYCSKCGNYIDENDNYCPNCGAKVTEEETPISDGTCRITATATDGLLTDDPKKRFWLSCGHDVGMYGLDRKPSYCPQCGAKVVE